MSSIEKKICTWIETNVIWIAFIVSCVLSLYVRWTFRNVLSGDMRTHLLSWVNYYAENGNLEALDRQVGVYTIPYQFFLSILSFFPNGAMYAIKALSCIFDYLLAFLIGVVVWNLSGKKNIAVLSSSIWMNLPMVYINSAWWGQCDSIYVFWCILACYLLWKDKYLLSFIMLGIGFAFKLQSVFILPFFLLIWLYKKKFSLVYFGIIPIIMIFMSIPGLFFGRAIWDVFGIYVHQSGYHQVSSNYASFWNFFGESTVIEANMDAFIKMEVITTIVILMTWCYVFLRQEKRIWDNRFWEFSYILVYTCVLFLPAMHERYDYMYIVLSFLLLFKNIRYLFVVIPQLIISICSYSCFLLENSVNWSVLTSANVIVYLVSCAIIIKALGAERKGGYTEGSH